MAIDVLTPTSLPRPTMLREVRTGKMAAFGPVQSGIDKKCRRGKVFVSKLGLSEDEHDPTFHGGIDKAVHQYCSANYDKWHQLYPDEEHVLRFVPGGFGENLVADEMHERNICAGDLIRIGRAGSDAVGGDNGCVLEVSIPRQPCFKLNQRFAIKNFAPRTPQLAMTGWYYRVRQEGWIEPGMELRVIERRHPQWPIARLHQFVHREKHFRQEMEELIAMPELGNECKDVFVNLKQKHEDEEERKHAPPVQWTPYRLVDRSLETSRVVKLTFAPLTIPEKRARIRHCSSVAIKLPNGLQRAYSVVEGSSEGFILGVSRDDNSRDGSTYLHDSLRVGDIMKVGPFSQNVSPNGMASHHIFIIGGIGITSFLDLMARLQETNQTFELHYSVRSRDDVAFASNLKNYGDKVSYYIKAQGQRLDIRALLSKRIWNSHVYTCGPERMIDEVISVAGELGMAEDEVHYEKFKVDTGGDPFTAEVHCLGKAQQVSISEHQTLLEALRQAGLHVQSSCETGSCGTCKIPLISGRVDHRGTALAAEEKGGLMLSCVSRGIGHIAVDVTDCLAQA